MKWQSQDSDPILTHPNSKSHAPYHSVENCLFSVVKVLFKGVGTIWAACYSGKRTGVRNHTAWVQVPFLPLWSSVAFEQGHLLKFFWASFSQSLKWEGWLRWLWRSFWLWYSSSMKKVTTTSDVESESSFIFKTVFTAEVRKCYRGEE